MIIPFILLTCNPQTRATVKPFESIMVSPLFKSGDSTIVVNTKHTSLHFTVYIQNDKYVAQEIASDYITKAGTYTYKYNNAYTRSNNKVFIWFYTYDASNTQTTSLVERNIVKPQYVYISETDKYISSKSLAIFSSDGSYKLQSIQYGLYGFDGVYVPSYYHNIDLSEFRIATITNYRSFISCTPMLVIKNYNGTFNDIKGANETVSFPLQLKEDKIAFNLELRDELYVDKYTLRMSSVQKDGYVKTSLIYFPVNEMQNQSEYECYITMQDFGIDRDNLIYNFKVQATRNVFGDCSNSKYCIVRENL